MVLGCTLRAPGSERFVTQRKPGSGEHAIGRLAGQLLDDRTLGACDARAGYQSCIWSHRDAALCSGQVELHACGAVRDDFFRFGIDALRASSYHM